MFVKNGLNSSPETPPDSRLRGNNSLISSPEDWFLPFTVSVNGLASIVATQSLQLGAVSDNSQLYLVIFSSLFLSQL